MAIEKLKNYEKAGRAPFLLSGDACVGERTAYEYYEIEYPDDCIVDFDMRLIDLFREMDKKSLSIKERIKQEYYRVKELQDRILPKALCGKRKIFMMQRQKTQNAEEYGIKTES